MEHENKPYSVYVKTDDKNRITAINSDAFISSLDGWVKIDEGYSDKYHHAQGNYLGSLFDDKGLYLYKLVDGKPQRRKPEEIVADYVPPVVKESIEKRIEKLEKIIDIIKKLLGVKD